MTRTSISLALLFHLAKELKLGSFDLQPTRARWSSNQGRLDWHERREGEEPLLGRIPCGEKNREQIELLGAKLHEAISWLAGR